MVHVRAIALAQSFFAMIIWVIARLPVSTSVADDVRFATIAFLAGAGCILVVHLFADRLTPAARNIRVGILPALILGLVLAEAAMASVVGTGYATPLASELAFAGAQHKDTIFHAALANMILHHGEVSLGVDGLVPVSYHVLSHRAIGIFGWLTGAPMLTAYSLALEAIILPVLNYSFLLVVLAYVSQSIESNKRLIISVTTLALLYFLSAFDADSFLASESHATAMAIFMLALLAMAGNSTNSGFTGWVVRGILLAVLIWAASLAKISVGAVLACGVFAYYLLGNSRWYWRVFEALCFAAVPFLVVLMMGGQGGEIGTETFVPFHFLFRYPRAGIVHLLVSAAAFLFVAQAWRRGIEPARHELALLVMILAAFVSSELLALPAGAALYFANPGLWGAVIAIAAFSLPSQAQHRSPGVWAAIGLLAIACIVDGTRLASVGNYRADLLVVTDPEKGASRRAMVALLADAGAPRKGLAAYVSPDMPVFWSAIPCWADAFFIQAAAATPLLAGRPPDWCDFPTSYGFSDYVHSVPAAISLGDKKICDMARSKQFKEVMVFRRAQTLLLDCRDQPG